METPISLCPHFESEQNEEKTHHVAGSIWPEPSNSVVPKVVALLFVRQWIDEPQKSWQS